VKKTTTRRPTTAPAQPTTTPSPARHHMPSNRPEPDPLDLAIAQVDEGCADKAEAPSASRLRLVSSPARRRAAVQPREPDRSNFALGDVDEATWSYVENACLTHSGDLNWLEDENAASAEVDDRPPRWSTT